MVGSILETTSWWQKKNYKWRDWRTYNLDRNATYVIYRSIDGGGVHDWGISPPLPVQRAPPPPKGKVRSASMRNVCWRKLSPPPQPATDRGAVWRSPSLPLSPPPGRGRLMLHCYIRLYVLCIDVQAVSWVYTSYPIKKQQGAFRQLFLYITH